MANEKRLIDANALLYEYCQANGCNEVIDEVCPNCFTAGLIADAPTVDAVEVVHGRWLFDSNTERYFCSACNEQALYTSRDVPEYDYDWEENLRYSHTETYIEEHLTDYCPNCGAKMEV